MKYSDYQDMWNEALVSNSDCQVLHLTELGIENSRLELYRDFVQSHYRGALKKMFPRLADVVNLDWKKIAIEYFTDYPPDAWDLNDLCIHFPDYLKKNKEALRIKDYHIELSRYELSEFYIYKNIETYESSDFWQINSNLDLHQFEYEIAQWVQEMDELEAAGEIEKVKKIIPKKQTQVLAISRSSETFGCLFNTLSLTDIILIEFLKDTPVAKTLAVEFWGNLLSEKLEEAYIPSASQIRQGLNFLSKSNIIL